MEKQYFWIKLKDDFFDSEQMDFVREQENGAEYIYIYLRLCFLAANNDGVVERRVGPMVMPYSMQKLAEVVKSAPAIVESAIALFEKIGLVERTENGAFSMPKISEMVGNESASAARKRKQRSREKNDTSENACDGERDISVTMSQRCHKNVTPDVTTEIRDKSLELRDREREEEKDAAKVKKFSVEVAIDSLSVSEPLKEALKAWSKMRKDAKKSPVSEKALHLAMEKLREMCGTDEALMVKVVNQSVFNDWKSFYALKSPPAPLSPPENTADRREQMKQAVEKGGW
jgi:predicted phage replisome organizer